LRLFGFWRTRASRLETCRSAAGARRCGKIPV